MKSVNILFFFLIYNYFPYESTRKIPHTKRFPYLQVYEIKHIYNKNNNIATRM